MEFDEEEEAESSDDEDDDDVVVGLGRERIRELGENNSDNGGI